MKIKIVLLMLGIIFFISNCKKKEEKGTIKITVNEWTTLKHGVEVGLGYSSQDAENESYFDRGNSMSLPYTFISQELSSGTYYYRVKFYWSGTAGNFSKFKSGAVTVKKGEATSITVEY